MNSQSLTYICNWFILLAASLSLGGCFEGAPHSNPLDPRSDNFENAGSITGTVTGFYPPFSGLGGVEIRLSPSDRIAISDATGRFDFVNIPPGTYALTAERAGFAAATEAVNVTLNIQTPVTLRMDGLPVFEDVELKTFHLSRWWPPPSDQYWLDVSIRVSDPDGNADIEAVFLEIPIVSLVDTLQNVRGRFVTQLREADIGVSVEAIAGHDINVTARDFAGEETVLLGQRISRIISEVHVADDPSELREASTNPPVFSWSNDQPVNFPYEYQVDITRVDENIPTLVQTITGIPSDSLSVEGLTALPTGQYFWTVSIIDEFGNQSRSREAGFLIR